MGSVSFFSERTGSCSVEKVASLPLPHSYRAWALSNQGGPRTSAASPLACSNPLPHSRWSDRSKISMQSCPSSAQNPSVAPKCLQQKKSTLLVADTVYPTLCSPSLCLSLCLQPEHASFCPTSSPLHVFFPLLRNGGAPCLPVFSAFWFFLAHDPPTPCPDPVPRASEKGRKEKPRVEPSPRLAWLGLSTLAPYLSRPGFLETHFTWEHTEPREEAGLA